jgi:hypothetical protein
MRSEEDMARWIVGMGLVGLCSWLLHERRQKRLLELEKRHQDELLDEALMESFPASDTPALTHPPRR